MTTRTDPGPTLDPDLVGLEVGPEECVLDARWPMAYAAGLGEADPRYFDTTDPARLRVHPLFPVCYEWPLALAVRARAIPDALAPFGVHATHDLVVHRTPRPGDRLRLRACVTAVEPRRAGTLVVLRLAAVDAEGAPVTTTDYGSLYRGVGSAGAVPAAAAPPAPDASRADDVRWTETLDIPSTAAHVYTECARIWNPIHTDLAVARAAGLPGLILHGTATLALAVSRVVARDLGGEPAAVRGVRVRFAGMVGLPSRVIVRGRRGDAGTVAFDAVGPDGASILAQGAIRS